MSGAAHRPAQGRAAARTGCGFTLVELAVSIAVMSILVAGLASAVLLASRALPAQDRPAEQIARAATVAGQIVEELHSAIWIRERTATSLEFALADRDADGAAERVRYSWSGTPGDALQRQYNGGASVALLQDVQEFDLACELTGLSEEYPGPPIESPELVLASYSTRADPADYALGDLDWIGQYFRPALPPEALQWQVSRVQFRAHLHGSAKGTVSVQLRPADADRKPTAVVLGQTPLDKGALGSSYAWREYAFSGVTGLSAGSGLCLVVAAQGSESGPADIEYDQSAGQDRLTTADAGEHWDHYDSQSMYYYVHGSYLLPGPPTTVVRYYVTGVRLSLRAGQDAACRVVTTAQTPNWPELLAARWETDFEADPTLDGNGDGQADWVVLDGGSFDTGSLGGGVWHADTTLRTSPDNDFVGLTTAAVRFRDTSVGGSGAALLVNADWSGPGCAPLLATVELQADGTQTAGVYHMLDEATPAALVSVAGLSSDFVAVRLLIDPGPDTVNVQVNGQDQGTYVYNTIVPASAGHFAMLYGQAGAAEFADVSLRVSE